MSYIAQTPVHSVNPLNSVPTTPTKYGQTGKSLQTSDKKLANATSDYLSDVSSNGDKAGNFMISKISVMMINFVFILLQMQKPLMLPNN